MKKTSDLHETQRKACDNLQAKKLTEREGEQVKGWYRVWCKRLVAAEWQCPKRIGNPRFFLFQVSSRLVSFFLTGTVCTD